MRLKLNPSIKVKPAEDIMVGYLAASVVENDCWKEEVAFIVDSIYRTAKVNTPETNVPLYKENKKTLESEFKEKNGLKQMPGKYRSAKSVICRALAADIGLLDTEGNPRGKTEVERDLKVKHDYLKVKHDYMELVLAEVTSNPDMKETSVYAKCFWCADYLKNNADTLTGLERDVIRKQLAEIPKL